MTERKKESAKKAKKKRGLPPCVRDALVGLALLAFAVCAAVGLLSYGKNRDAVPGELTVYFLDVGQGDSTLLVLPDGRTVLVDAAEAENADDVCRALLFHGVTRIDEFVLTHPHSDHGGAALQVAERFGFSRIWMPETAPSYIGAGLLAYAEKNGVAVERLAAGVTVTDGAVRIEALNPVVDRVATAENADSGVLLVTYGETRMLLMGDADSAVEENLRVGAVDLLRVGHHGSNTSTSMSFLLDTAPRYAVISVGVANDYGHPHYAVLGRLANVGAAVFRTDADGEITARSDGETLTVTKSEEKPTSAAA